MEDLIITNLKIEWLIHYKCYRRTKLHISYSRGTKSAIKPWVEQIKQTFAHTNVQSGEANGSLTSAPHQLRQRIVHGLSGDGSL